MSSSFNTTIKSFIKNWYFPILTGFIFILAGIYLIFRDNFFGLSTLFGSLFIISSFFRLIFSIRNRKVINGWAWYFFYELLIFCIGLYIFTYPGNSLVLAVGFTSMFYSGLLLGTSLDLQRHEHPAWANLAIASILGILFSLLVLTSSASDGYHIVLFMAFSFIAIGVSSVLLSLEFKKVNKYHSRMKKLMGNKHTKLIR